ncbi:LysR substrate-binding domain-containing protein [Bordetella sp. LUAb4]|uniref:LysR substrate-binding domain-containing protein n=1 Tax=Bordetella sp. LUAb4 TaxID=2843195 RepID=UPI001E4D28CD|nr:LysR substrate-binding domain-containing protein [Bordetella sp. LUAb4]
MKLDIEDLRFILALAQHGSLAALARAENVTPPAITKRLNQLEARLGLRLALRTTRRLQLTHEGHLLTRHATDVLDRMQAIEDALQERSQVISGKLKVHAPFGFGRRYLAPLLARFHEDHPNVEVQLSLSDSLLPPPSAHGRDAFDVVISIGELPDIRWVSHPVAPNRRLLCAAPAYLAHAPALDSPQDLAAHACLVLRENDEDVTLWRFAYAKGARKESRGGSVANAQPHTIRVHPTLESNDGDVIHQWCLAGQGVMIRSEWDVASNLTTGKLVALLPHYRLPDADVVALVPAAHVESPRARRFIDLLRKAFRPQPPWRVHTAGQQMASVPTDS